MDGGGGGGGLGVAGFLIFFRKMKSGVLKNGGKTPQSQANSEVKKAAVPAFGRGSGSFCCQPKLAINQVGDKYEQEADFVADQIMRMPDRVAEKKDNPAQLSTPKDTLSASKIESVNNKTLNDSAAPQAVSLKLAASEPSRAPGFIQTKFLDSGFTKEDDWEVEKTSGPRHLKTSALGDDEDALVQRRTGQGASVGGGFVPPIVSEVLSKGDHGQPMNRHVRMFMESRFGADFSQVRIHDDGKSAESAAAINARAYTFGSDIVFGKGEYQPDSQEGKRLLAHELVHVEQQGNPNLINRKPGDVTKEISAPLATVDDNIGFLLFNYERIPGTWGVLDQVMIITGTTATFYRITVEPKGFKKERVGSYKIRSINFPPSVLLGTASGKFGVMGIEEIELSGGEYDVRTVLLGSYRNTPQQKKDYDILDKELTMSTWFVKPGDFESFSGKLTNTGFAVVILAGAGGGSAASKSGDGGEGDPAPPMPKWMPKYQEALTKLISETKKAEPEATDLPDKFWFYYSPSYKKYRGVAQRKEGKSNPIKAYLDIEEATPVETTLNFIRTKLRIKQLSDFRDSTKEDSNSENYLKDDELWALELILLLRKKIYEDRKGRSDRYDLPDAIQLITEKDYPGLFFLSVSVRIDRTKPSGEAYSEMKTVRLRDPLRKEMTVEGIWPTLLSVTFELREDRRVAIWPDEEKKKYKKIRAPYPAEIVASDTRDDFIAVKGGVGNYKMKIVYERYEGTQLPDLVVANMQTVYFRWTTFPVAEFFNDDEKKAVAAVADWKERRSLLVNLLRYKTLRQDTRWKLSGGWQRDDEGEVDLPKEEGDYLVYCEAYFEPKGDVFRMPSEAFFPIHVVDGYKLARQAVNAQDNVIDQKRKELELARANKSSEEHIKDLVAELKALEDARGQSMLGRTKAGYEDTAKALSYARKIKAAIKDHPNDYMKSLLKEKEGGEEIGHALMALWMKILQEDTRDVDIKYKIDWAIERIEAQAKGLKGVLDRAAKFDGEIREPTYSPVTAFVSDSTATTYHLLTILGESGERSDYYHRVPTGRGYVRGDHYFETYEEELIPNKTVMVLIDVTSSETQRKYKGVSYNPDQNAARIEATKDAYREFGKKAIYGTGYVHYKVPGLIAKEEGVDIRSTPGTWEKIKKYLSIIAAVAGVIALAVGTVASGGLLGAAALAVGLGAGAIGAGLAISNISDRLENHTFEFDVEFALDVLNVVGFFASVTRLASMSRIAKAADEAADLAALGKIATSALRLEKGFMIYQRLETGANIVLTSYKTLKDLEAIEKSSLTDKQKSAMRTAVMQNSLLSGMMIAISVKDAMKPLPTYADEMSRLLQMRAHSSRYLALNKELGLVDKDGNWLIPELKAAAETQEARLNAAEVQGVPSTDSGAATGGSSLPETGKVPVQDTIPAGQAGGGGGKPPTSTGGSHQGGGGRPPRRPPLDADSRAAIKELEAKIADLKKRAEAGDGGAKFYLDVLESAKRSIQQNPGAETVTNARETLTDIATAYPTGSIAEGLTPFYSRKLAAGDEVALLNFLRQAKTWKNAVSFLQSKGKGGKAALEALQKFREHVIKNLSHYQPKEYPGSKEPESDKDIFFTDTASDGAGANLIKAEAEMKTKYGDDWSAMFRMNFYTEGDRLLMFTREEAHLTPATRAEIMTLAEEFNLAKMLRHASGDESSEKRVEGLIETVAPGKLDKIRGMTDFSKEPILVRRDRLHKEVDVLRQKYNSSDTPPEQRPAIAAEISKKQIEINYLTEEAYISPAALKMMLDPTAVLTPAESRSAVLSNVEMMEHIIHQAGGDITTAARQYELYKYMSRASKAMQHQQQDLFFDALNKTIASVDRNGPQSWTPQQLRQHYDDFMIYLEKYLKATNSTRVPHSPPSSSGSSGSGAGSDPIAPSPALGAAPRQLDLPLPNAAAHQRYGVQQQMEPRVLSDEDIIVDTNVLRALDMEQKGEKLQDRHKLSIERMRGKSVAITPNVTDELAEGGLPQGVTRVTKIMQGTSDSERRAILDRLSAEKVGGEGGLQDRLIIRQAFYSETASGKPAKFATADDAIIKPLARIAGIDPSKLGRYKTVAEYLQYERGSEGFEVSIGTRTLYIIPIQPIRNNLKPTK